MQFPINTGPKEDHPQRVAKLVGVDPKYYYKAEELKLYEDAINALYALLGAPNSEGNKILDYTIEWVKGTYTFKITVRKYIFNGVLHTNTIYAEITLGASDLVYNRFDSFLIDANEQIIVWPGDAIEFPYPKEFDLDTYVLINFFRVDANTTEPVGISEIKVFDDGTGAPNEWTINYLSGTLSLEQASSGTKAIKLVNKQAVLATAAVPYEGRFLKDVIMKVFCATSANNRLRFSFWINDTMRVGEIYVSHGQFNFNAFLVGQWQTIVIPGSAFRNGETWGNYQYNSLWLNNDKSGTTVYLDDVRIQQTTSEQVSGATHTHSNLSVLEQITQTLFNAWNAASTWITTNGANVLFKTDAKTTVSPTNKLITEADVVGGSSGTSIAYKETPPETPNGVITAFTTIHEAIDANFIWIYMDGVGRTDFTYNKPTKTITMGFAPEQGTSIIIQYLESLANPQIAITEHNNLNGLNVGNFQHLTATEKSNSTIAYNHSQTTHAPTDAQKNSDITKSEIETKLTGVVESHEHNPAQIIITTSVSITTDTVGSLGKTQKEKNVIIDNGVNAINITVNGGTNFLASYLKHGTGLITFVQGAGRTLALVDGTAIISGAVGSTAIISSVGTKDYLRISNV